MQDEQRLEHKFNLRMRTVRSSIPTEMAKVTKNPFSPESSTVLELGSSEFEPCIISRPDIVARSSKLMFCIVHQKLTVSAMQSVNKACFAIKQVCSPLLL